MPEPKLTMIHYLALQNTYGAVQIALYSQDQQKACIELDKTFASKECLNALQKIMNEADLTLSDIAFIACNQGPGPFTTLRVVIATINGLSFARKIPLIGINAIEAFLQEFEDQPFDNSVVLLNAFGDDLYYGIKIGKTVEMGCASSLSVMERIDQNIPHGAILFLGNGIQKTHGQIESIFASRMHILSPNPQTVRLEQIARMGLEKWNARQDLTFQLQPLYFKAAFNH